jgi:hypothetical protein
MSAEGGMSENTIWLVCFVNEDGNPTAVAYDNEEAAYADAEERALAPSQDCIVGDYPLHRRSVFDLYRERRRNA